MTIQSESFQCPFHPYCKFEGVNNQEVLRHVKEKHHVIRSTSYGDQYYGNGSRETLEINNE